MNQQRKEQNEILKQHNMKWVMVGGIPQEDDYMGIGSESTWIIRHDDGREFFSFKMAMAAVEDTQEDEPQDEDREAYNALKEEKLQGEGEIVDSLPKDAEEVATYDDGYYKYTIYESQDAYYKRIKGIDSDNFLMEEITKFDKQDSASSDDLNPQSVNKIMTTTEVAETYDIADATVRKAILNGWLKARKSGGTWLISKVDAEARWGGKKQADFEGRFNEILDSIIEDIRQETIPVRHYEHKMLKLLALEQRETGRIEQASQVVATITRWKITGTDHTHIDAIPELEQLKKESQE